MSANEMLLSDAIATAIESQKAVIKLKKVLYLSLGANLVLIGFVLAFLVR